MGGAESERCPSAGLCRSHRTRGGQGFRARPGSPGSWLVRYISSAGGTPEMVHRTLGGLLVPVLALFLAACGGGSGGSSGGGGTQLTVPPAPTGVIATAGNAQVSLSWNVSSGATSYHVRRATVSGGPYTVIATPTATNAIDASLNTGTAYIYVVS